MNFYLVVLPTVFDETAFMSQVIMTLILISLREKS